MTERPILFSAPMVRAILDGNKTQTRRIVKHRKDIKLGCDIAPCELAGEVNQGDYRNSAYGEPGDQFWVRETWGVVSHTWDDAGNLVSWVPGRPAKAIHEMPYGSGYYNGHVIYAADGRHEWAGDDDGGGEPRSHWRPSIHMPRAASRITLEVTRIRIERLQTISEADCRAEGCAGGHGSIPGYNYSATPSEHFQHIWTSINGITAWTSNPWVCVIEFKRIEP